MYCVFMEIIGMNIMGMVEIMIQLWMCHMVFCILSIRIMIMISVVT